MLQPHHALHPISVRAIEHSLGEGVDLEVVAQNLVELWVVATRPVEQNGLGATPAEVAAELARLKSMFILLPDSAAVYAVWERLVIENNVSGKLAHDARIVAAMQVHGVTSILTFDRSGFSRYRGIEVVRPQDIAG